MSDNDLGYDDTQHREPGGGGRSSALPWVLFVLTLAGLGALGYFGYGMLDAEKAKADAAHAELQRVKDMLDGVSDERKKLFDQVNDLQGQRSQLATERDALNQEVHEKDSEIAKLKATYDDLNDKMKAEIQKGEIRLSQVAGRVQVDLVDKILFDSGEAKLSPHGEEVLSRVGNVLAKVDDKQIQVTGHTDDAVPTEQLRKIYPTNWELSVTRAVNVVRFLTEKAHVPAKRLVAAGYGQYHPIASNADPAGRARNRRIEILLTPAWEHRSEPAAKTVASAAAKPKVVAASAKAPAKKATAAAKPPKRHK